MHHNTLFQFWEIYISLKCVYNIDYIFRMTILPLSGRKQLFKMASLFCQRFFVMNQLAILESKVCQTSS